MKKLVQVTEVEKYKEESNRREKLLYDLMGELNAFDDIKFLMEDSDLTPAGLKLKIDSLEYARTHHDSEIEKRDKLLEQSYVTMKYFACVSDEIIERKDAEQWLKQYEEIRGGK